MNPPAAERCDGRHLVRRRLRLRGRHVRLPDDRRSWLISHRTKGSPLKGLPYESGIPTYGDTHGRFGVSYYIYALLFVAFDIEVIFIFLWALVVRDPIPGLMASMMIFVGILLLGLAYAWRKGVLTWR